MNKGPIIISITRSSWRNISIYWCLGEISAFTGVTNVIAKKATREIIFFIFYLIFLSSRKSLPDDQSADSKHIEDFNIRICK